MLVVVLISAVIVTVKYIYVTIIIWLELRAVLVCNHTD